MATVKILDWVVETPVNPDLLDYPHLIAYLGSLNVS
jgi:hypothetical protein